MRKKKFSVILIREGKWFVAQCLEIDIASQGKTEAQALKNLREALELHLEHPRATQTPAIHHLEVELSVA